MAFELQTQQKQRYTKVLKFKDHTTLILRQKGNLHVLHLKITKCYDKL